MRVEKLISIIGADFYTGIPDSQLKDLCDYLMKVYGIDPKHHVIAANEGNCTALAAGYYMATGKVPVVYMQNSGEGNIINPVASLLNENIYKIPVIFIIGWRGEPGIGDEPQHIYQGKITKKLLDDMGIDKFVIGKSTKEQEVESAMQKFKMRLSEGRDVAFIIQKDALFFEEEIIYKNNNLLMREEIIRHIVKFSGTDPIISTTGKTSRELFEVRVENGQTHSYDFLTVGSMGHCSSIALGIAINKPKTTVWCIDGDGAILMHLGAMPVIGKCNPENFIHIVINNGAHESVGGQPTVMSGLKISDIAKNCGYSYVTMASTLEELDKALIEAKEKKQLSFIEVNCAIGARDNLGRPTTSALENKENFMNHLKNQQ